MLKFIRFYWLIAFLFCTHLAFSQDTTTVFKRSDVYVEAMGPGLMGSVNYEYQLDKVPGFGIRAGISIILFGDGYVVFPLGLNYIIDISKRKSFIELSSTISPLLIIGGQGESGSLFYFPSIGYRRHFGEAYMFRYSISLISLGKFGIYPWGGISFGKRF